MKKILAMAAVVALTAGVSSYAMDSGVKFSGDVNVNYNHMVLEDTNSAHPKKEVTAPLAVRVRIQADAQLNEKLAVSGRFVRSEVFHPGAYELISGFASEAKVENAFVDRLHVVYTPSEKVKLDLGRVGVEFGTDGIFFEGALDGAVASYKQDKFALEAGSGRINSFNMAHYNLRSKTSADVNYIKGSFDITDNLNVVGFISGVDDILDLYGASAKVNVTKNVSVYGDYIKFNTKNADLAFKDYGIVYGKATDKVGSYEASLAYYDIDKGVFALGTHPLPYHVMASVDQGTKFLTAKAKATVMKGVSVGTFLNFNGKISGGEDVPNAWGLEVNYKF